MCEPSSLLLLLPSPLMALTLLLLLLLGRLGSLTVIV
jgi:hypothetical protein